MQEVISHATSKREEYYVIRFDNKEFKIKVRHHKDYPEVQEIEVTQQPNMEDRCRCIELIKEMKR